MRTTSSKPAPIEAPAAAPGKLYIVGTPIGNLEDMTFRAIRTLKEVDLIACEDTRRTAKLLNHYSVSTRTISYHEHNEMTRAPELIIDLEQGSQIALVSDAGMPVISDPGYRLVKLAIRHGVPVIPVPGASAFLAALAAAGLPVDKFRFLGFLPPRRLARQKALKEAKDSSKTLIFYEAPHRVTDMLADVERVMGDPSVVVAREVTKIYEEFLRGSASEVLAVLKRKPVRGEITVLVGPPASPDGNGSDGRSLRAELAAIMVERGLDERAALKVLARSRRISKSEAYRQLQAEKE
ncbi:MAG TPA: 16S rRNA (cytidine(1402)-2'-O)-methyltransferase [Terriglobia bacterium]|nr:16S rRNA (cytidine(1402)-2'-O)-methyltransferase [Terriglobia bacterium]